MAEEWTYSGGVPARRLLPLVVLALVLAFAATALAHPEPNDVDGDTVPNAQDNCSDTYNPGQADDDADGTGNACDPDYDRDGDGFKDTGEPRDNCPTQYNPDQSVNPCNVDRDGDGLQDYRDKCPDLPSFNADTDNDQVGNECDADDDGDARNDTEDNCPLVYNPDQVDADLDDRGRECDADDRPSVGAVDGGGGATADAALEAAANSADTAAPRLTVQLARRLRLGEIGRTLVVPVRCSEACAVSADLVLTARVARRVGLARGRNSVVIGRGSIRLAGAARSYVFVDLGAVVTRRLRRLRSVPAAIRIAAEDGSGNRRVLTRTLELRR